MQAVMLANFTPEQPKSWSEPTGQLCNPQSNTAVHCEKDCRAGQLEAVSSLIAEESSEMQRLS